MKVGRILLGETLATDNVVIVVLEDTARGVQQVVDALFCANVRDSEGAEHIGSNSLHLVVLTPVDIGPASNSRRVQNVRRLVLLNLRKHCLPILGPRVGQVESFALLL